LSVADNAGDAVLLHVSAPSERQEWGNKSGLKKRTKHEISKHHDVCGSFCIVVLFHKVSWYTFIFTSCFMSENHIKTTNETPSSNYSLSLSHQNAYAGKYKTLSFRMTSL